MLFNSYIFILLFLPLCLIGYFLLGRRNAKLSKIFLLLMSFWFYGYFNYMYLILIISSIAINYFLSRLIIKYKDKRRAAKALLIFGVCFNIGLIGYYKYYDFFISQINIAFGTSIPLKDILLPLGISFFTFQQLSFIVDTYKEGSTDTYSLTEYALFVSFFPQLVAGPIVLHSELIPQFRDEEKRNIDLRNLISGICMFGMGLFKKMLIADRLGKAVEWGFSNSSVATSAELMIVMFAYTFQIYFDFSGYSDMAVGIGRMFNFKIPPNFNSPYKAISVTDFWRRWHMTLTRFLRTYIYIPLGGSKKGKIRTYINIMVVFLASGIWHGANWTFILWGIIHGLAQCIERIFGKVLDKIPRFIRWLPTFLFVSIAFFLFRADSVSQWTDFMGRMFTFGNMSVDDKLVQAFFLPETWIIYDTFNLWAFNAHIPNFPILLVLALCLMLCLLFKNNNEREFKSDIKSLLVMIFVYTLCIISLGSVSTFLYFNF